MGLFSKKPKFTCDCGMSFPDEARLQAHVAKAHVKTPGFACGCGSSFASKAELQKHAKTAHGM